MEEIIETPTLKALTLLLAEVSEKLKSDENSSDIEAEVYFHLHTKIVRHIICSENQIQQDYNCWEFERKIFYTLTHFLAHIPFAKQQPLWRKLLLCSEKAFPFEAISKVLSQIKKTNGIMYKIPSSKMSNAIFHLKLSHMDLPLTFIQSLTDFKQLQKLKLRNITVDRKLLWNVANILGECLPENLESLDLSRNLLGVKCVTDDQSEPAQRLKIFFSRVWALKKLVKLNLSNNLINNSFFITFCLYMGEMPDRPKNTVLRELNLCANTLSSYSMLDQENSPPNHPLWPLYKAEDCPQNIFPPFFEKFEQAKLDVTFNFMMHLEEDIAEAKKNPLDVLVIHQDAPYVESVLLPDYILSMDKPLAVITQKDNHAFILTEHLEENYQQIKISKINPMGDKRTKKIGDESEIGIWRFIHGVREYLIEEHKKYSFSREVIRDKVAVSRIPANAEKPRKFSKCAIGSAESCYTNSVRLFNETNALPEKMEKKSGLPCFNMVRDRKGSVNRYYFFRQNRQEVEGMETLLSDEIRSEQMFVN